MEWRIIALNFLLNIRTVAPDVPKWRHEETLSYVDRVEAFVGLMDPDGCVGQ